MDKSLFGSGGSSDPFVRVREHFEPQTPTLLILSLPEIQVRSGVENGISCFFFFLGGPMVYGLASKQ
jgi:hypothetical protein